MSSRNHGDTHASYQFLKKGIKTVLKIIGPGISLLDIFGKLYTSIINRRINFYVNLYSKLSEAQAGFREGYSTVDNLFILQSLISKYLSKRRRKIYLLTLKPLLTLYREINYGQYYNERVYKVNYYRQFKVSTNVLNRVLELMTH